jgi:hypothetical protein
MSDTELHEISKFCRCPRILEPRMPAEPSELRGRTLDLMSIGLKRIKVRFCLNSPLAGFIGPLRRDSSGLDGATFQVARRIFACVDTS